MVTSQTLLKLTGQRIQFLAGNWNDEINVWTEEVLKHVWGISRRLKKEFEARVVILACQGDGSHAPISVHHPTLFSPGHEVALQTQPPYPNEDAVQTQDPKDDQNSTNRQ